MVKVKGNHIKAEGSDEEIFEDVAVMIILLSDIYKMPIIDVCATLVQKAEELCQ